MSGFVVRLPWPDKLLNPNARVHWVKLAHATRKARTVGWFCCKEATSHKAAGGSNPVLRWEFFPPDRRHRDTDNTIKSCKAFKDGIADALGIDDKHFLNFYPPAFSEPVKGGAVVVTIEMEQANG